MNKISGVYAASLSILNNDLTLNVKKTIQHAEMIIDNGCHGVAIFWKYRAGTVNSRFRKN